MPCDPFDKAWAGARDACHPSRHKDVPRRFHEAHAGDDAGSGRLRAGTSEGRRRRGGEAQDHPDPRRCRACGEQGRLHPQVGRRADQAAGLLRRTGQAPLQSLPRRQAEVHHQQGKRRSVQVQADRWTEGAVCEVRRVVQDECLSDAPHRGLPAVRLRRDLQERARGGDRWRRRDGDQRHPRHPVSDSEVRQRGDLEPQAALSRSRGRPLEHPGGRDHGR